MLGRGGVKVFGHMLEEGEADVILVGHPTMEGAAQRAFRRARKVEAQGVEAWAAAIQDYVDGPDRTP